jgi:hypothetical protein
MNKNYDTEKKTQYHQQKIKNKNKGTSKAEKNPQSKKHS